MKCLFRGARTSSTGCYAACKIRRARLHLREATTPLSIRPARPCGAAGWRSPDKVQPLAFHLIDTAAWSLAKHNPHRNRRSRSRTRAIGCCPSLSVAARRSSQHYAANGVSRSASLSRTFPTRLPKGYARISSAGNGRNVPFRSSTPASSSRRRSHTAACRSESSTIYLPRPQGMDKPSTATWPTRFTGPLG